MEKTKRRNYECDIDLETCNQLLSVAIEQGLQVDEYIGSLMDSYIVYDTDCIKFGRVKPRNYIIVVEKFVNCWSSKLVMIMTDDKKLVEEYEELLSYEDDEE